VQQIKRYWVLFIISICAVWVVGGNAYLDRISIKQFDPVPSLFRDYDTEMLLVRYDGSSIQYYYKGDSPHRLKIVLSTLKKLTLSVRHKLPKGDYIISLHDGIRSKYPWPVLAFASTEELINDGHVVLIPDPESLSGYSSIFREADKGSYNAPWSNKISKVFWRGSATGAGPENNDLNGTARLRLLNYANKYDFTDVGFTFYTLQHNPNFKELLASTHSLVPRVSIAESIKYKYLIDVDGNSCTYSRMAWILYSNSILMKHASSYKQWYYDKMLPNVHYLPISEDFSNLKEQYLWAEDNPDKAQAIAENGRIFAKRVFNDKSILDTFEQGLLRYNANKARPH
jgi:hypothetical protein